MPSKFRPDQVGRSVCNPVAAMGCKRARSSFPRRCSCRDMAKLFRCNGLELAEWARQRVEDDDEDEDEDDEDALWWLLPTASCRLPTSAAAEGRDRFIRVHLRSSAFAKASADRSCGSTFWMLDARYSMLVQPGLLLLLHPWVRFAIRGTSSLLVLLSLSRPFACFAGDPLLPIRVHPPSPWLRRTGPAVPHSGCSILGT